MFKRSSLFFRLVALMVALCVLETAVVPPQSQAQNISAYTPGRLLLPSSSYHPPLLKGLRIDPDNPFDMSFIVDGGDAPGGSIEEEASRLVKYFLTVLTFDEKSLWVNLSMNEPERIMDKSLAATDMGRDMLTQDYLLKQLASSLTHPDSELGKDFWDGVYQRIYEATGRTEIPSDMTRKVWIVPQSSTVHMSDESAFISEAVLDVMTEEEYLGSATSNGQQVTDNQQRTDDKSRYPLPVTGRFETSRIFKDIILPAIKEEVNNGKTFAVTRQIYHSLILAIWFKKHFISHLIRQAYAGRNITGGIDIDDPLARENVYQNYLKSVELGAYRMIRDAYDPEQQTVVARQYYSGGYDFFTPLQAYFHGSENWVKEEGGVAQAMLADDLDNAMMVNVRYDFGDAQPAIDNILSAGKSDPAMPAKALRTVLVSFLMFLSIAAFSQKTVKRAYVDANGKVAFRIDTIAVNPDTAAVKIPAPPINTVPKKKQIPQDTTKKRPTYIVSTDAVDKGVGSKEQEKTRKPDSTAYADQLFAAAQDLTSRPDTSIAPTSVENVLGRDSIKSLVIKPVQSAVVLTPGTGKDKSPGTSLWTKIGAITWKDIKHALVLLSLLVIFRSGLSIRSSWRESSNQYFFMRKVAQWTGFKAFLRLSTKMKVLRNAGDGSSVTLQFEFPRAPVDTARRNDIAQRFYRASIENFGMEFVDSFDRTADAVIDPEAGFTWSDRFLMFTLKLKEADHFTPDRLIIGFKGKGKEKKEFLLGIQGSLVNAAMMADDPKKTLRVVRDKDIFPVVMAPQALEERVQNLLSDVAAKVEAYHGELLTSYRYTIRELDPLIEELRTAVESTTGRRNVLSQSTQQEVLAAVDLLTTIREICYRMATSDSQKRAKFARGTPFSAVEKMDKDGNLGAIGFHMSSGQKIAQLMSIGFLQEFFTNLEIRRVKKVLIPDVVRYKYQWDQIRNKERDPEFSVRSLRRQYNRFIHELENPWRGSQGGADLMVRVTRPLSILAAFVGFSVTILSNPFWWTQIFFWVPALLIASDVLIGRIAVPFVSYRQASRETQSIRASFRKLLPGVDGRAPLLKDEMKTGQDYVMDALTKSLRASPKFWFYRWMGLWARTGEEFFEATVNVKSAGLELEFMADGFIDVKRSRILKKKLIKNIKDGRLGVTGFEQQQLIDGLQMHPYGFNIVLEDPTHQLASATIFCTSKDKSQKHDFYIKSSNGVIGNFLQSMNAVISSAPQQVSSDGVDVVRRSFQAFHQQESVRFYESLPYIKGDIRKIRSVIDKLMRKTLQYRNALAGLGDSQIHQMNLRKDLNDLDRILRHFQATVRIIDAERSMDTGRGYWRFRNMGFIRALFSESFYYLTYKRMALQGIEDLREAGFHPEMARWWMLKLDKSDHSYRRERDRYNSFGGYLLRYRWMMGEKIMVLAISVGTSMVFGWDFAVTNVLFFLANYWFLAQISINYIERTQYLWDQAIDVYQPADKEHLRLKKVRSFEKKRFQFEQKNRIILLAGLFVSALWALVNVSSSLRRNGKVEKNQGKDGDVDPEKDTDDAALQATGGISFETTEDKINFIRNSGSRPVSGADSSFAPVIFSLPLKDIQSFRFHLQFQPLPPVRELVKEWDSSDALIFAKAF